MKKEAVEKEKSELKDTNWISIDDEKEQLTLDFSQAMAETISSNAVLSGIISDQMNSSCNTYVKEGYISIKYNLGL